MNAMDTQRYDRTKRPSVSPYCSRFITTHQPFLQTAYEESDNSDTGSAYGDIPSIIGETSSVERPQSPLLTAAGSAVKIIPLLNSPPCPASGVPRPLSPPFPPQILPLNGSMEDIITLTDALEKDSLMKFAVSSEHDSKLLQRRENAVPPLISPLPRVPNTFILPMQPFPPQNVGPARIFSRPSSPSPILPAQSPLLGSGYHFWQIAFPNTEERQARSSAAGSLYDRFHGCSTSDHSSTMSCPTSPLLRPSNAFPCPTSPPACHAMFSDVSRRLRVLSFTPSLVRGASPAPSRPTSPISRPTSPILQAFSVDNWVPERDPTEGIDVIEIFVTKEISIHVEEMN